ncbi:transcriptional regulator GntR family [Clostridium aceticum]|uniref:Transcriptional regulator GntR family n=1 Tax=Clostridium aceticum TaxID=84022 RepID=A0A0G3W931_9CLOT|nr:transcriptional regulator GntR family [Clostridium aceticum]
MVDAEDLDVAKPLRRTVLSKYSLIIDYIRNLSEEEKIKTGQKLPSVRLLADKFQCSTLTAVRAYKELEQEHFIYSVPKSGYYLVSKHEKKEDLSKSSIYFSTVLPDIRVFSYDEIHHCLNQVMERDRMQLFSYGEIRGLSSLIETLMRHLQDYQIFCKSNQIVVTSGVQQAVNILANLQFPNGKNTILMENPTYDRMIKNLQLYSARTIGINRDFNGIDLGALEKIFREEDIKCFYMVPRFHDPTGGTYSMDQKKEILRLAQKYDVYILEDDYFPDLDTNTRNDPIYSLDNTNRVIYLKTFSKILLPDLRIAAVVLPEILIPQFLKYKQCTDIRTSVLRQGALDLYISNGMFKRSVTRLRNIYKDRMDYLKDICSSFDSEILDVNIPDTGFFLSMRSSKPIDYDIMLSKFKKDDIIIKDIRESYLQKNQAVDLLKISICKTDNSQIKEGILKIYNYFLNQRTLPAKRSKDYVT